MLDSFDVMLYAMVLAALMSDMSMAKATAGLLGSLTLVASAVGGLVFGVIADRFGRRRALMGSILIYSVFTAACGFAHEPSPCWPSSAIFLGLGMGGEWASGAALVSETWPAEHRGKALGIVQSSWAIGYAAAAAVAAVILPVWGWRGVFFVGVVPAFFTLWIQQKVKEPEIWQAAERRRTERPGRLRRDLRAQASPADALRHR
ncbi:MAG: MFS transporter [Ignavibacteriales bacterium]|nr:MFS transporter [Ignavibacteriales bacterium]